MTPAQRMRIVWLVLLGLGAVWLLSGGTGALSGAQPLTFSEFEQAVTEGRVDEVLFTGSSVSGVFDDGTTFSTYLPPADVLGSDGIEGVLDENGVAIRSRPNDGGFLGVLLPLLFPLLLFVGFFWLISRQTKGQLGGLSQIGKSTAKLHKPSEPTTKFDDIAGYREVKEEVQEVVGFLREPAASAARARRCPRACSWSARPAPARRSSRAPSPARRGCPSSPSRAPTSSRCSSASAPAACATCSRPPARTAPRSSSSTSLTPSGASAAPASAAARRARADPQPAARGDRRLRRDRAS